MKQVFLIAGLFLSMSLSAQQQLEWQNVDSAFGTLPSTAHIYFTEQKIDSAPFRAFYFMAQLKDKKLDFTTDTTYRRRLTPSQFYQKNDQPLVVVNGTFFSFATNENLNVVVNNGKLVSFNPKIKGKGVDSTRRIDAYRSAIGIYKNRKADVAWIKTDSTKPVASASQFPINATGNFFKANRRTGETVKSYYDPFSKWKVQTAIGGGPVLVQQGEIRITNDIEGMFAGKAVNDKHPRTAMGYTKDNQLIILVVEGRNPAAGGASLLQLAQIMKNLGCVEALNLDGGGSSCLLVNGKETIRPSDKEGQRAVPAVFLIRIK